MDFKFSGLSSKWLVWPCCTSTVGSRRSNSRLLQHCQLSTESKGVGRTPAQCHSWHHTIATKPMLPGVLLKLCAQHTRISLQEKPGHTYFALIGHRVFNDRYSCLWKMLCTVSFFKQGPILLSILGNTGIMWTHTSITQKMKVGPDIWQLSNSVNHILTFSAVLLPCHGTALLCTALEAKSR